MDVVALCVTQNVVHPMLCRPVTLLVTTGPHHVGIACRVFSFLALQDTVLDDRRVVARVALDRRRQGLFPLLHEVRGRPLDVARR